MVICCCCAISKVNGHAEDEMVRRGRVRPVDKLGNDMADEAADFGRRRVHADVIDCRRHLVQACRHWYLVVCDLHRFFIAIARATVNDDGHGATALDPLVWSAGSLPKRRRVVEAVRRSTAKACQPVRFTAFWPTSWVVVVDKV